MQLTLRPATNQDQEAIEALVFGVLAEYGLKPDPDATDADLQDIEHSYIARGGLFDVLAGLHRSDSHETGYVSWHSDVLILIRFQDEPNSGRVPAWQDHAGSIHSLLSGRN